MQRNRNLKREIFHKLSKMAATKRNIQQRNNKEGNSGKNKIFANCNAIEREVNNNNDLAILKSTAINFQQYSCRLHDNAF